MKKGAKSKDLTNYETVYWGNGLKQIEEEEKEEEEKEARK